VASIEYLESTDGDHLRHSKFIELVTASGWGLNPDKDAIYLNITPNKNDGRTIYKLNAKDVPVDGLWPDRFAYNQITKTKSSDDRRASDSGVVVAYAQADLTSIDGEVWRPGWRGQGSCCGWS
jgi:hypothetical protein